MIREYIWYPPSFFFFFFLNVKEKIRNLEIYCNNLINKQYCVFKEFCIYPTKNTIIIQKHISMFICMHVCMCKICLFLSLPPCFHPIPISVALVGWTPIFSPRNRRMKEKKHTYTHTHTFTHIKKERKKTKKYKLIWCTVLKNNETKKNVVLNNECVKYILSWK